MRREEDFLSAFARLGCYLEDLAKRPINELGKTEREAAYAEGIAPLARRIKPYQPLAVTLVIKRIERPAKRALGMARMDGLPVATLPFPNWPAQQAVFEAELARLVRSWRRRGVLAAVA